MTSIVLDGKALADKIKAEIKSTLLSLDKEHTPVLATILVGENPSSHTYVNMKRKACESVGMESVLIKMGENTTTSQLLAEIHRLNENPNITGILLQHPSPPQVDERLAFDSILHKKDVDGVTIQSFGKLSMNEKTYLPCTPYGMILLLDEYKINITGKHAVVVGRSPILGKPMAMMLTNRDATITLCHSRTKNLPDLVKQADIVVGAVGKPEFIKGDWIKPGAVVLDAGYNPGNVGDIELSEAVKNSSYHTPVPGGVGPMTIAVLLKQTILSYQNLFPDTFNRN